MKITMGENHSHIAIIINDGKTSSIADEIIKALDYFENKNPMLKIIDWKLERFDNADTTDYYLFIDHEKEKICSRKNKHR